LPAIAVSQITSNSALPNLGAVEKSPGIVFETFQVITTFLHDKTRQTEAADTLAQRGESFTGDCHFALRIELVNVEAQREHQHLGAELAHGRQRHFQLPEEIGFAGTMGYEVIGKVRLLIISRIFTERFDDFFATFTATIRVSIWKWV
jgi:hypothetical protein